MNLIKVSGQKCNQCVDIKTERHTQLELLFRELSNEVISLIASAPQLQDWPACQRLLLDMLGYDDPWLHALPVLSCQAVDGNSTDAFPVAAAWITLLHAGNLIDDVQDGDLAHLTQFGRPDTAIAIALSWIFFAFRLLEDYAVSPESRNRVFEIFTRAGINSSRGQYQDLISGGDQSDRGDILAAYWEMVINKSGSICMAGTAGGAAIGTDQIPLIESLGDFGIALGVVRQVLDDCRDLWIDTKNYQKQATLPLILQELAAGDKSLLLSATERRAEKSEQPKETVYQLLSETGIPGILADILLEWRRRALGSLQILKPSESRDALVYIFEYNMKPKPYNT